MESWEGVLQAYCWFKLVIRTQGERGKQIPRKIVIGGVLGSGDIAVTFENMVCS